MTWVSVEEIEIPGRGGRLIRSLSIEARGRGWHRRIAVPVQFEGNLEQVE